jgi:hypothetical protein
MMDGYYKSDEVNFSYAYFNLNVNITGRRIVYYVKCRNRVGVDGSELTHSNLNPSGDGIVSECVRRDTTFSDSLNIGLCV